MNEIRLLAGSNGMLVLYAPLTLVHRGKVFVLVETARHGLLLEAGVSTRNENGLTHLTARLDTTPR